MRVLLVTYHFPPDAEVGAVRPLQIARHLPQFGIEPWVLTVERQFAESPNVGLIAEGVPEERILRTHVNQTALHRLLAVWQAVKRRSGHEGQGRAGDSTRPAALSTFGAWGRRWLGFPDERKGWYRPAIRAAGDAVRGIGFDAVLSTSPPRVATLIAASLASRHGLPWVMDLRDPWWGAYPSLTAREPESAIIGVLQDRLFRRAVAQASLVVHNTEQLRQLTCRMIPDSAPKTRCIPNGCDDAWRARRSGSPPAVFRIGHYGNIMGRRSPEVFLRGLRLWLDTASPDPARVAVRFVGGGFDEIGSQVQLLGLSHIVQLTPPVPRQEVPAHMETDYVLLLVANAQPLQIPGKTYEYLAAGRRILALADHDGATADFLKPQIGCIVAERADEVRASLERFYRDYLRGAAAWVDRTALLDHLQYPNQVDRFAQLLREAVRS